MTEVVDNGLGLTQYICANMNEEQALNYLLAVEPLTLQDWKASRALLPDANTTNRQTKEKCIEDIIYVFKNTSVDTTYLVRNLAILPGLSPTAIQLISYSQANLYAVNCAFKSRASQSTSLPEQVIIGDSSRTTTHVNNEYQAPLPEFPPLQQTNNSLTPSSGNWKVGNQGNYKCATLTRQIPLRAQKGQQAVVHGTSPSTDTNKRHPLAFVCIGVRSGENETTESLTEVLNKWNCLKDVKVEAVRKSYHSSTFRVQFNIPISCQTKWKEPSSWPARITAFEWRGNPKAVLKPLAERLYTKRIYVGNLPSTTTLQIVTNNHLQMYEEEVNNNVIQKIDTYWNNSGNQRATLKHSQNPAAEMKKSVCVVLTSYQGKSLDNVVLKPLRYIPEIRRTLRYWNGQIPLPQIQPEINLSWC